MNTLVASFIFQSTTWSQPPSPTASALQHYCWSLSIWLLLIVILTWRLQCNSEVLAGGHWMGGDGRIDGPVRCMLEEIASRIVSIFVITPHCHTAIHYPDIALMLFYLLCSKILNCTLRLWLGSIIATISISELTIWTIIKSPHLFPKIKKTREVIKPCQAASIYTLIGVDGSDLTDLNDGAECKRVQWNYTMSTVVFYSSWQSWQSC